MTYSDKILYTKLAAKIATTLGVSKVVHDIIQHNVTIETAADSAKVWVGSFVIGGMVTEQATEHVDRKIDGVVTWLENRKTNGEMNPKMEYKSDR